MPDEWALRPPAFHSAPEWVHTFGPEVASVCRQAGFEPDPEQALALDDIFGVDEHGLSTAYESAVIAPRQALKTGLMKQAAIGWMFVTCEETVTWSAHLFDTTQESFLDLSAMFLNVPMFRKRLKPDAVNGIHAGNTDKHILLRDDRRLRFRSRTKTGGRGLTGDKIILDEAFALAPEHLGTLLPTLTVVPDPQILYGSSAGLAYSYILREIRDRGRSGSRGLAYLEWCARRKSCPDGCKHWKPSHPKHDPRCALDDVDLWREAYPLMGRQRKNGTGLSVDRLRKFREAEPAEEWMRERLGWWEESGAAEIFGPRRWENCEGSAPDASLPVGALGVAVSIDQSRAAIVAAAQDGDLVHVQPLHHEGGTSWVVPALEALQVQLGAPVVIDGRGPGADLIPLIESAGLDHHVASTPEVLDACSGLFGLVRDERLRHATYVELENAVAGAVKRDVGDRWAWGRKTSTTDISPLEAATLAVWAVQRPKQPEPVSVYESRGVTTI